MWFGDKTPIQVKALGQAREIPRTRRGRLRDTSDDTVGKILCKRRLTREDAEQ